MNKRTRLSAAIAAGLVVGGYLVWTTVQPASAVEDKGNPTLESVNRISISPVQAADFVQIAFASQDDKTGIGAIQLTFRNGTASLKSETVEKQEAGTAKLFVPGNAPAGVWTLSEVTLSDRQVPKNEVVYLRNGEVAFHTPGSTGTTRHAVDFSKADFSVIGNGGFSPTPEPPAFTPPTTTPTTAPPPPPPAAVPGELTTGPGSGGGPHVRSFNLSGESTGVSFMAGPQDGAGAPVARGDLDGDGVDEIVVGSAPGRGTFSVFTATGEPAKIPVVRSGRPFGDFLGGVNVAIGNVDSDAAPEIIVGAGPGTQSFVRVFNANGTSEGDGFIAFDPAFLGGVNVAAGDLNGDGRDEIITAPQSAGAPVVMTFNANGDKVGPPAFYAYGPKFTGGLSVASADIDADGRDEIITGAGRGGGPHVQVFNKDGAGLGGFFAFAPSFSGGVNVAAGDVNGDGRAEIAVGAGPGGGPHVKVFNSNGESLLASFFSYAPAFNGGVYVALTDK